ncbi:hypothetical protein KZY98_14240 [Croceibacter atlanticus]|uniref:hypothetical protein n=1 Tax=Croceibacter atlanticus TaxID=313588 RepID=UPI001C5D4189|nr:hypothetical protein [Croceibacter atlanticus]MBW4971621.1 hypothetical protein [Croceibacter atlanticus]
MNNDLIDSLLNEINDSEKYRIKWEDDFDNEKNYNTYVNTLNYMLLELKLITQIETNYLILTNKGFQIIISGGWIKHNSDILENKNKSNKRDEFELKKLKLETKIAENVLKEFPKTKWFARIGFITGIVLLLKELYILIWK